VVDSNDEAEGLIRQLFRAADQGLPAPDPSLRRRILAHLEEVETRAKLRRWRRWAILSPLAAALVLVAVFVQRPAAFEARVDTAVLIRVEVEELQASDIAYVEVELADDVTFYSNRHPGLDEKREIRLAWIEPYQEDALPIVVRASTPGLKRVKLRFLDRNDSVLEERELKIDFRTPLKHGGFTLS
jgi:hypothetical protein